MVVYEWQACMFDAHGLYVKSSLPSPCLRVAAVRKRISIGNSFTTRILSYMAARSMNAQRSWTALMIAAQNNSNAVAELLIHAGADVEAKDNVR